MELFSRSLSVIVAFITIPELHDTIFPASKQATSEKSAKESNCSHRLDIINTRIANTNNDLLGIRREISGSQKRIDEMREQFRKHNIIDLPLDESLKECEAVNSQIFPNGKNPQCSHLLAEQNSDLHDKILKKQNIERTELEQSNELKRLQHECYG